MRALPGGGLAGMRVRTRIDEQVPVGRWAAQEPFCAFGLVGRDPRTESGDKYGVEV